MPSNAALGRTAYRLLARLAQRGEVADADHVILLMQLVRPANKLHRIGDGYVTPGIPF
jgi:hypothetical protein